jgi:hypothetical protein
MVDEIVEGGRIKSQSAIEYLTTYGWAILIIAIVLIALFNLGLFNPSSFVSTTCTFPAQFGCLSAILTSSSGILNITLQQATQSNINVTAIGCNNLDTISNMITPNDPPSNQVTLTIGGSSSFSVQCYQNGTAVSVTPGSVFKGYVLVNYTTLSTNFPHTATGTLVAKAV